MIKIPSIIQIEPQNKIVTLNEFFSDFFKLIDTKFKNIDIFPLEKNKSNYCKHKKSCIHNCLIGFIKGFFKSYAFQTILNILKFLIKIVQKKAFFNQILQYFITKNALILGLSLAIQNFILKFITCLLRYLFQQNSQLIDFISGFLAGILSFHFIPKSSTQFITFYIFSRIFEAYINLLEKKNIIKRTKYDNIILFSLQSALTGAAFAMESKFMNPQLKKIYQKFCTFDYNLLKFKQLWEEKLNLNFK